MSDCKAKPKIKITDGGPYIVTGGVKLSEKIITPVGNGYAWTDGEPLPQSEVYALCRCGKSKNPPFCDGFHVKSGFKGTETAEKNTFMERAKVYEGAELDLYDDGRCALPASATEIRAMSGSLCATQTTPFKGGGNQWLPNAPRAGSSPPTSRAIS